MLNKNQKKTLSIAYVFLLVFIFIFSYRALNTEFVKVVEKEGSPKVEKEQEAKVTAYIENNKTYEVKLTESNTILDLLEELKKEEDLMFEKILYSYGIDIEHLNYVYPEEDETWAVFANGEDVTYELRDTYLEDHATYEFKITRIEELQ